jgi:hypothetical protein
MGSEEQCRCGEIAAFACEDCAAKICARHFCSDCRRCEPHCVCAYRFWIPFDF